MQTIQEQEIKNTEFFRHYVELLTVENKKNGTCYDIIESLIYTINGNLFYINVETDGYSLELFDELIESEDLCYLEEKLVEFIKEEGF